MQLLARVSPMDWQGFGEQRCPGNKVAVSGIFARRCVRLSYISLGFPPGRSVLPQPSRKSVSPATSLLSTKKHWLPGVWPGVWISSMSIDPTVTLSPLLWVIKLFSDTPVTFCTRSASSVWTWIGIDVISKLIKYYMDNYYNKNSREDCSLRDLILKDKKFK